MSVVMPTSKFRRIKRTLIFLSALVLFVAALLGITYYRWTRGSLPQMEGEIILAGLKSPVTVRRDEFGVPHITASNLEDLAQAQGYVTAQDRLWQMDLMRRAARGELSELFGADRLKFDQAQRRLGYGRVAERAWTNLSPELQMKLEAYARGVNAYIETHRGNLPVEFHFLQYEPRPWQPTDSLVIGKLIAQSLNTSFQHEIMRAKFLARLDAQTYARLFPEFNPLDKILVGSDDLKPEKVFESDKEARVQGSEKKNEVIKQPLDLPNQQGYQNSTPNTLDSKLKNTRNPEPGTLNPEPGTPNPESLLASNEDISHSPEKEGLAVVGLCGEGLGSNNWVISGKRTTTGKPLLCNDPHLGHAIPSIWYMVHLMANDGKFNVAGVVFPGAPGVIVGHNNSIAWGVTNFGPDVQDLYFETFNPANPVEYRVGDHWEKAEIRTEVIHVRNSLLSTATHEDYLQVAVTRHGPVVREVDGKRYALRWTALDPETEFSTFNALNTARNWGDFQAALKQYPGPMQNFVYADIEGNIGYWGAGRVPVRKSGDGSIPTNGATGEGDWERYIPFEELPHLFNPPEGFIVTANQRITGKSIKQFYSHEWYPPYRASAIRRRIEAKEKLSPEDMSEIHRDVWSYPDDIFVKEVLKLAANHQEDENWQQIERELTNWKGELLVDSRVAAVVTSWRRKFCLNLVHAKLGEELAKEYEWEGKETFYASLITERPLDWLPRGIPSYDELLVKTYRETLVELEQRLGKDQKQWRYGKINTLEFAHPLGTISLLKPIFNSPLLEMGGSGSTPNALGRNGTWGVSMRMTVDLQNLDNSRQNLTVGESGQPASSHYLDEIPDWQGVKPHVFAFSPAAVEKQTRKTLVLKP